MPILLLEGFADDIGFFVQAARTRMPKSETLALLKGGAPIEMQFTCEHEAASQDTFLLMDLRHCPPGGRGLFESIGKAAASREFLPLVILVSSMEDFREWRGMEAKRCWQLRGAPSGAEMAAALRSFLHLCANWPNSWQRKEA
jgi:hypothetical protein